MTTNSSVITKNTQSTPREDLSSGSPLETSYKRLELLLIGFASIFITSLWIGVFSSIMQHRDIRFSFLPEGSIEASVARNLFMQARETVEGMLGASGMVADTAMYQFVVLWESACFTQNSCNDGITIVSAKLNGVVAMLDGITAHSQSVVATAESFVSFDMVSATQGLAGMVGGQRAYASTVLGEKTFSQEAVFTKLQEGYVDYVDFLTFGAYSAIAAE